MVTLKDKNICKFIPASVHSGLETSQFIYESNQETIHKEKKYATHAAILIIKGKGTFNYADDPVKYSAGYIIFVFKEEDFFMDCDTETEYMYITFDGMRAEELFKRFGISKEHRVFQNHDGLIPLWKESLSSASEDTVDLAAESMLLYTFSRLYRCIDKKNAIINGITEITENRFNDPELSMTAIAKELGYNANYLSHLFKSKAGVTYSEHLRNIRIKYAISLLEHGIDSVKNVALLSGFEDPLYFSTVFKKTVGVSPKEYIGRD